MVDCWWGIVEAHAPQQYNWYGYKELFRIVREHNLKLQVSGQKGSEFLTDSYILMSHYVLMFRTIFEHLMILFVTFVFNSVFLYVGGYVFS